MEELDYTYMKKLLERFTYEDCKIFIQGPELATKQFSSLNKQAISGTLKEKWFGTQYKKVRKFSLADAFKGEEKTRDELYKLLVQPRKNPYIPEKQLVLTSPKDQQQVNDYPTLYPLG